ncbi:cobalt-precorrin-6A reductase [Nocardia brevicatena]|uniref:cobalt-precorrin-6A reductase n=1 Tax=Nocardia brevicatena TaxID=37327 RepID=UPI0002FE08A3|nr:cobalt-precorrin-6A reductase [Nocardia brevicatena]
MGGTREARELARTLSGERGFDIVSSLAGRVRDPILPEGAVRIGGFGGVDGLRDWLRDNGVRAVVDATHPFAATITEHAVTASAALDIPLIRFGRPGWTAGPGDRWWRVPDLSAAAATSARLGERILLTVGRQGVGAFAGVSRPWFLIRAIEPPDDPLPPRHEILLARGPFTVEEETDLLARHRIDVLVTKDSGGGLTSAKLVAAREVGVPVVMVNRPPLPSGITVTETVAETYRLLCGRAPEEGRESSIPGSRSNQSNTARS